MSQIKVLNSNHVADCLLMVPPNFFGFNVETALDNEFQHLPKDLSPSAIIESAMAEFTQMVNQLRSLQVDILILENNTQTPTPDAVFPNNWFSYHFGKLYFFPMKTINRQQEIQPKAVSKLLCQHNYPVLSKTFIGDTDSLSQFFEGTGVVIWDHTNHNIYAALSERCHYDLLMHYAELTQAKEVFFFDTVTAQGRSVYHTNVLLSIGEQYAVICAEVIVNKDRQRIIKQLAKDKELIFITEQQMRTFCANILQIRNKENMSIITISQNANNNFTKNQKKVLGNFGQIVPLSIPTIELVGGGGVRCMLAEVFF